MMLMTDMVMITIKWVIINDSNGNNKKREEITALVLNKE